METSSPTEAATLSQLFSLLRDLLDENRQLSKAIGNIEERLDLLALQKSDQPPLGEGNHDAKFGSVSPGTCRQRVHNTAQTLCPPSPSSVIRPDVAGGPAVSEKMASQRRNATSGTSSRIILTTYPGQSGIDPIIMNWGHFDPSQRGPVVVSRSHSTVRRRNAIGAHGGSYSVYHALAVASKDLDVDHKPDFTNTEPAVNLGPFPQWADAKKIVSLDPLGHISPWLFESTIRSENVHLRPTIAITKAHMKLPELEQSVRAGRLVPDGKICLNATGELAVTKFAVEPVWYLPGVAERFGIDEGTLRRSLFENTGGSFPELITRGDMKLFLPPIGGLTVYCFGDPSKMSDPTAKLALRIHDECNGSDVFGSDICTCRPYLIFGVEEAVKEAQRGGSGVVVYFRKEGRALGEVTKYLVYNAREDLSIHLESPPQG
ncbi:MAG: hypothetical protein Q9220_007208 [cf. Caloplaca sp. 1 TL-2023]